MTTALFETAFHNFAFCEFVVSHIDSSNSRSPKLWKRNLYLRSLLYSSSTMWPPVVTKPYSKILFTISRFGTSGLLWWRVSGLDSSISQYLKLWNGVISRSAKLFVDVPISGFRCFAFRRFDISVMKCFDTSSSRYPKLSSCFRDFGISHFAIPGLLMMSCLDSSNSWYLKLSSCFQDFSVSHFAILGLLMMKSLDSSNSRYPKLSSFFRDFVTLLHLAL